MGTHIDEERIREKKTKHGLAQAAPKRTGTILFLV